MTATTGDRLLTEYLARLDAAALRLPPDRRAELVEGIAEHVAEARAAGELPDETAVRTLIDRLGDPEEIVAAAGDEGGGGLTPPWPPPSPQLVPRRPGTGLEIGAVVMLTVGSLIPVLGWLVGVVLLWVSRRWRVGEKILGTLVVPGGPAMLVPLALVPTGETCSISFSGPVGSDTGGMIVEPQTPPGAEAPAPATGPPDVALTPPPQETATTVCEAALVPGWLGIALAVLTLLGPFVVAAFLLRRARARAAGEQPVLRPAPGSVWTSSEIAAVLVLGLGSFVVPVVGTVVGLVLVWRSPRWTPLEKGVATTLALASVAVVLSAMLGASVTLPFGLFVVVFLAVFGHVLAAGYLALVLNRRGAAQAQ